MNGALRVALQKSGLTTESLAERIGVDPKTTDRWLREGRIPHQAHRTAAAGALGCAVSDIWPDTKRRYRDLVWFRPWEALEREAHSLRSYQPLVLPGLLQTERYARALFSSAGQHTPDDVERLVAARMARQSVLAGNGPPWLTAVIDEGVLRRSVGGPEVMREQLESLAETEHLPHVRVHVVPSSAGAYAGLSGPFVIASSADNRTAGYLDTQLHGQVASEPADLVLLMAAWENVRGAALSHGQSITLIREVAETWT
ncbi:helix-turn-helix transcriptional regulator [Micromonospora sp. NPDC049171]|uniref:helix-turn-helix transcriptional regulator n=1 Tax=Micromonospora sp. NPDC049171 TaxID=3155770 RepID=UPI0033FEB718